MPLAYHASLTDADGLNKGAPTLKRELYLAVREPGSPLTGANEGETKHTPEANMKFALCSVHVVILALLATALLTACGEEPPPAPHPTQNETSDESPPEDSGE